MMESGHPAQLGASWDGTGTNFALYSGCAEAVELCLFDAHGRETGRYRLPGEHDGVWCGFLPGTAPGQQYGYRVHWRFAPAGHRSREYRKAGNRQVLFLDRRRPKAISPVFCLDPEFARLRRP